MGNLCHTGPPLADLSEALGAGRMHACRQGAVCWRATASSTSVRLPASVAFSLLRCCAGRFAGASSHQRLPAATRGALALVLVFGTCALCVCAWHAVAVCDSFESLRWYGSLRKHEPDDVCAADEDGGLAGAAQRLPRRTGVAAASCSGRAVSGSRAARHRSCGGATEQVEQAEQAGRGDGPGAYHH
jgi:hypothetical protein